MAKSEVEAEGRGSGSCCVWSLSLERRAVGFYFVITCSLYNIIFTELRILSGILKICVLFNMSRAMPGIRPSRHQDSGAGRSSGRFKRSKYNNTSINDAIASFRCLGSFFLPWITL